MEERKWLIAREIPRLRRYAMALTGDPDQADDLVQDCLERAIRKRHLWRKRGTMRSWLYRVLYNVFLNQRPEFVRRRSQTTLETIAAQAALCQPARQVDLVACSDIAQAMQELPAEQRAAIALTALEGLAYEEAAKVMGIPVGTLRSRISRGREGLRLLFVEEKPAANLRQVK